jgi:cytochrome c peroxidase
MTRNPRSAGRRSIELIVALAVGIAAGSACATEIAVTQKDRAFSVKELTLHVGDELVMHNQDTRAHNIQINNPELTFNSGIQEPGEDARVRFAQPDRYLVFCGIHPKMKLWVDVK